MRIPMPQDELHSDHVFQSVHRGHGFPLQYSSLMSAPGHPPSEPSVLMQTLLEICIPPPQVAEQDSSLQLLHDGHGSMLQELISFSCPEQGPTPAGPLTQTRDLVWVPPPHVTEQPVNTDHVPQYGHTEP